MILVGHVLDQLGTLPDNSVQCCVTSPPYWGLRSYKTPALVWGGNLACDHAWGRTERGKRKDIKPEGETTLQCRTGTDGRQNGAATNGGKFCTKCDAWLGDLGLEPTPKLFVEHLVTVFREVRRVLKPDGTCWVNMGDSYSPDGKQGGSGGCKNYTSVEGGYDRIKGNIGIPNKNLLGIPWRVAFGLQDDGWILRSDVIWSKPNAMPDPVKDRPTVSHEHIFLLSKSRIYLYDHEAIKEPCVSDHKSGNGFNRPERLSLGGRGQDRQWDDIGGTRNARTVWTIATQPYPEAHFATFPEELPRRCIMAGSREGDTILDPFGGSGTTGAVATELGRDYILIELNPDYAELARKRIANKTPGLRFGSAA